jgi:hypothetical protein
MSKELKYVILRGERPVLLSPILNHSDVVGPNVVAESAGSCRIHIEGERLSVSCYGESLTLKLKARVGDDSEIIERFLNEPTW